jgi:hypothetical protein
VPFDGEYLEDYIAHGAQNDKGRHFATSILVGRTFFTTESGHMGIGSRRMQIGDEVCVLFCGETLFILRPIKKHYRLVGECYVHGLMQGEPMEQWNASDLKDQWFELR